MFSKLILICVFIFNFKECFLESQGNMVTLTQSSVQDTWSGAMNQDSGQCNVFSSDILRNLSMARASTAATFIGQLGWIGAYRYHTHWIRLKSCTLVDPSDIETVSSTVIHGGTQNSVTFCTNACRNSVGTVHTFALSEFHCFCLSGSPVFPASSEPTRCPGDVRDFCGRNGNNYQLGIATDVMFYETDETLLTNGSKECMTVEYTGDVLTGGTTVRSFQNPSDEDCTKTHGVICIEEGTNITSRMFYNDPRTTWTNAVSRCYQQTGYQISTDLDCTAQSNSALNTLEKAWLGIFRRHYNFTISKQTDILSTQANIHCIAATVDNTGKLHLSNHDCQTSLPVWCMSQPIISSSSTSPMSSSTTTPKITMTSTIQSIITNSIQVVTSDTQDTSLLITISVLATVLGVGILIAIVILIRKILQSRQTQSNVSIKRTTPNRRRPIQANNATSHYEDTLDSIYEDNIYSVIITNDEETPRYSEIYDDIENNEPEKTSSVKYVNTLPSSDETTVSVTSQQMENPEYLEIISQEPQNISNETVLDSDSQDTDSLSKVSYENTKNEESSRISAAHVSADEKEH